tara:strand:+ start:493 stop:888 length:396 start_codon:yes stop_codon:yes gene_type:complete
MKISFLIATLLAMWSAGLHARTWTSADGTKTFEAELRSYHVASGTVAVVTDKGVLMKFPASKLSEADNAYLKEQNALKPAPSEDPAEMLSSQAVGEEVLKAKLHRLEGKRFRRAEIDKAPEYYILYYSASW